MKMEMTKVEKDRTWLIVRFYTVYWDEENGNCDDKSFRTKKDAEAFYESLNVPYKKLTLTNDWYEVTVKSEKSDGFPEYFGPHY